MRGIGSFFLAFIVTASAARAETIELLHFWTSPSERAALNVFVERMKEDDNVMYCTPRKSEAALKSYAIERIANGYAPAAVQWHGGPDIEQLITLGITKPLEEVAGPLDRYRLLPVVQSLLRVEGGTGALPVGLHTENWAWINLDIYRSLSLSPPRDWEDFLDQSVQIRAAGYRPLALGGTAWERTLLFLTVLLDVGGGELYRHMIDATLNDPEHASDMEMVFALLMRLRDEAVSPDHAHKGHWSESTADVIAGAAAMHVMGDWAKGAFLNAGKVPGRDFACVPAPGNDDVMSLVLDVFVLPENTTDNIRQAQKVLIDVVLAPENQKLFAQIKGSLPVVDSVAADGFDACARLGMSILAKPDSSVPSMVLSLPQQRISRIQAAVQTAWDDPSMTPSDAVKHFMAEYGAR